MTTQDYALIFLCISQVLLSAAFISVQSKVSYMWKLCNTREVRIGNADELSDLLSDARTKVDTNLDEWDDVCK